MNLIVDQGNTFIKIGLFDHDVMCKCKSYSKNDFTASVIAEFGSYDIDNVIVSSVAENTIDFSFLYEVFGSGLNVLYFNSKINLPFSISYTTPKTLGNDRIAALAGAFCEFKDCDRLIIDAGTAITIDFLDKNNIFVGGNISPGLQTRFNSLNYYTHKLPLLQASDSDYILGDSTTEAIQSGVKNGVIFELDAYIDFFIKKNASTKVILTGGDAVFLANRLKNHIFVRANLVLAGLNTIIKYNV